MSYYAYLFAHVSFRWKGENVATTEVSDVIGMLDFIQEANVYGIPILGKNAYLFFFHLCCFFLDMLTL